MADAGEPKSGETAVTPATVLIVDDDRVTREFVAGLLRGSGMNVITAEHGKAAIDRVGLGGVDCVLLDVVMPGLSGIDSCRMIKSMTTEDFLPVILVTAKADADSRVEGLRIGADDYVSKPFDERELLARIHAMMRLKRMHDQVVQANTRLERLAVRDDLTGLYNPRYLESRLNEEFKRAERYRDPLACAVFNVDELGALNDKHGTDTGDAVLAGIAARLREGVREIDVIARNGGDTFLLAMPSTHFSGALTVADRIWRMIGEEPFVVNGRSHAVTVSVGVALYPSRDIKSKGQLVAAAERALSQAKGDGKNCICVFQHQGYVYRPDTQ